MIKEITPQIAALYLGQKCDLEWLRGDEFSAIKKGEVFLDCLLQYSYVGRIKSGEAKITPHLRRLSSMTEAEAREVFEIMYDLHFDVTILPDGYSSALDYIFGYKRGGAKIITSLIGMPAVWLYLLGKGFDLFGLIEAGLAKDISGTDIAG